MHSGRAKKIRQAMGYDVSADDIMSRQYDRNKLSKSRRVGNKTIPFYMITNTICVGIRKKYREAKKRINRGGVIR